jgi:hypothetical protein
VAGGTALYLVEASAMSYTNVTDALNNNTGEVPVAPETLAINGQRLLNNGISNADGSVWGMTLISAPAGAPVKLTTTGPAGLYSFTNQAQEVKFKIFDANNGQDLTLQTNMVIVGQQMNLYVQLSVTNFAPTSYQWTIPGFAISNNVMTIDIGIVYTNFPTGNSNVVFYWMDGGMKLVQISATVNGVIVAGQAWFNVLRPTATLTPQLTSNQPPVSVGDAGYGNGITLHPGSYGSPAITFIGIVTAPTNGVGVIAYTQLAAPERHVIYTNNIAEKWTSNGTNVLDGRYGVQYGGTETSIDSGGVRACIQSDTPEQGVDGLKYVRANDHFQTYLMYKYGGDSSNSV